MESDQPILVIPVVFLVVVVGVVVVVVVGGIVVVSFSSIEKLMLDITIAYL